MSIFLVFASVFGVSFVAELPDKTALTTFVMMATRHKPLPGRLAGAAAALAIQSLVAVAAGALLGEAAGRTRSTSARGCCSS